MSKEPLHPLEIPEDTTRVGLVGWMAESVARGLALRLAGIIALLGATVAALSAGAPAGARIAAVVVGLALTFALLISQLSSWRRSMQWLLILGTCLACVTLLLMVVNLR